MNSHDIYLKMVRDIEDYAILFLDRNGTVLTWNKGAAKIKGYADDEIIGKNFKVFYTPQDQQNNLPQQLLLEAERDQKAVYEGWRVRKDGTLFWGSIVVTALYDNNHQLIGFTKITKDLTEKKIAEEQLAQFNLDLERKVKEQNKELYKNEKRFRALVENNHEALSLRDANKRLIYQSPGTEKLFGFSFEEMKNMPHDVFFHPDDAPMIVERMDVALQNPGVPVYSAQWVRHKDGHYIWMEGTITNMLHDENIGALVGNYREITERKKAEQKLLQANRLYAFVSAINQTIVHVKDEDTLYREVCRIAVEVGKFELAWIGLPDIKNKTIKVKAHNNATPEDLAVLNNMPYRDNGPTASVLRSGKPYVNNDISIENIEHSAKQHSVARGLKSFIVLPIKRVGETYATFTLHSLSANVFDDQELTLLDEVVGDISFALDVLEKEKHRIAMEEQIAHSEKRLRQAQSIAHFGSWELDFKDGFGIWTEEACRIYGLDPSDNVHTYAQWLSFIHPADLQYVLEMTTDNGNPTFAFFHRIVRKDGTIRHIYSQAEKEYTDGIPTGLYGVVHDITDMKTAEEEKVRMMSDIVMRNKDLEQFSYIVSHNLRAPVANIMGITDLMLSANGDPEETCNMLNELSVSAGKLDSVVRDLNTILQVRSPVSEKKEVIRLQDLVNDIAISINTLLKNEDAKILCDFSMAEELFSVKSYIYSICTNLITNSVKYRRTGVQPIIRITTAKSDAGIELTFSDNGLGIDMAKAGPYIFGLYKRFHHHVEGKGIGLYMVKAQVETLGGRISVQSEVNNGTTFRILLPDQQAG